MIYLRITFTNLLNWKHLNGNVIVGLILIYISLDYGLWVSWMVEKNGKILFSYYQRAIVVSEVGESESIYISSFCYCHVKAKRLTIYFWKKNKIYASSFDFFTLKHPMFVHMVGEKRRGAHRSRFQLWCHFCEETRAVVVEARLGGRRGVCCREERKGWPGWGTNT